MRQLVRLGMAMFCVLISPIISSATVIGACEIDLPGLCTKSVDINSGGTQFTIVLTNTSAPANGGFITADAFSLPGTLGATLATTGTSFTLVSGAVKVAPINIDREFLLTTDPSPDPQADAITCRLATERFVFRPRLDDDGKPVAGIYRWRQRWF